MEQLGVSSYTSYRSQEVMWRRMSMAAWDKAVFPESFFDRERMLKRDSENLDVRALLFHMTRRDYDAQVSRGLAAVWQHDKGNVGSRMWRLFFVEANGTAWLEYTLLSGQPLEDALQNLVQGAQHALDHDRARQTASGAGRDTLRYLESELLHRQKLLALTKTVLKLHPQYASEADRRIEWTTWHDLQAKVDRLFAQIDCRDPRAGGSNARPSLPMTKSQNAGQLRASVATLGKPFARHLKELHKVDGAADSKAPWYKRKPVGRTVSRFFPSSKAVGQCVRMVGQMTVETRAVHIGGGVDMAGRA